jgi:hypothetical protein
MMPSSGVWWILAMTDSDFREFLLIAAAAVTLLGVWLCWLAPHHRMSVEENAKDGRLTDEQARVKIKRIAVVGPLVTFFGLVAVGAILLR